MGLNPWDGGRRRPLQPPPRSRHRRAVITVAAMRPLLTRLFTSTHIAMASSSSSSSYPSRRLIHLTRHLTASSSSGELSSVGAPAAAADAAPAKSPRPAASKVHAAVLVCLFEDPSGGPRVLLTKRASTLNSHSGRRTLCFLPYWPNLELLLANSFISVLEFLENCQGRCRYLEGRWRWGTRMRRPRLCGRRRRRLG